MSCGEDRLFSCITTHLIHCCSLRQARTRYHLIGVITIIFIIINIVLRINCCLHPSSLHDSMIHGILIGICMTSANTCHPCLSHVSRRNGHRHTHSHHSFIVSSLRVIDHPPQSFAYEEHFWEDILLRKGRQKRIKYSILCIHHRWRDEQAVN